MLHVPPLSAFGWRYNQVGATRPTPGYGTSVTPGNNTKGSWASLVTAGNVTEDVCLVIVNINSNSVSTAIRNALVDIGIDTAGGTSYSVLIPDLLTAGATAYITSTGGGGIWYVFPIRIPAGSSIAARAAVNNATVGTLRCFVKLFGQPKDPSQCRVGSFVTAFGITAASSAGTAVTSGTTAEGSWTQIGSAVSGRPLWWWQVGWGCANGTMAGTLGYHTDMACGDASNKKLIIEDHLIVNTGTTEAVHGNLMFEGCEYEVPSGQLLYARMQCSGTPTGSHSVAVYGVGGQG